MNQLADADFIASIAFLRDVPIDQRAEIAARLVLQDVERGSNLVSEGDPSDSIFFVLSGRFIVHKSDDEELLAEIGVGEPIGEIGFFAKIPRSATVTAVRDSTVLCLGREAFQEIASRAPSIYEALLATTARRLAEITARARKVGRRARLHTIAIIGAGDTEVPALFLERLRQSLDRRVRVLYLTGNDQRFDGEGVENSQRSRWLNEQEADYRLIIYIADAGLTSWSRTAAHQADEIIVVTSDDVVRPPGVVEQFAFSLHPVRNRRVVCIHPRRRNSAEGTANHLCGREAFIHHHVALQDELDIESLSRFLTGQAIGFVAGGGGGFGPAHVGIFQAFEEWGVKFDVVGGTSVGAAMMAGFALRGSAQVLVDGAEDIFVKSRSLKQPTWPKYALLDHFAFDAALKRQYRGCNIEDAWRNFFCLSTDLSTSAPFVHRRGPLWRAVRASASMPGVLPPVYEDGHMLVDGGLIDNVPLATMQQLKTGPNVVVHFGLPVFERFEVDYESIPGRMRLVTGLLSPFHRKWLPNAPGPIDVLRRSLTANSRNTTFPAGTHDFVVQPPAFPGSSFMDWSRHREVYEASYRWAKTYIAGHIAVGDPALMAIMRASGIAEGSG